MASAGAFGAAGGWVLPGRRAAKRQCFGLSGHPAALAGRDYRRSARAEPWLRRSIPVLVFIFLGVAAIGCVTTMAAWRTGVERDTATALSMAAERLANSPDGAVTDHEALIGRLAGEAMVLALTDRAFKVAAVSARRADWRGATLDTVLQGAQPLFLFGDRAGIVAVRIDGERWLAATSFTADRGAAAFALVPERAAFASWQHGVSITVTMYVLTAGVLLLLLYAYYQQAWRAENADGLFHRAQESIDLALMRGRCGLWDWDLARGAMYWSPSMYHMLGYASADGVLSFGEVRNIVHPDDVDLYTLAHRLAAREIEQIDHIFRMRHAEGHYVLIRARAQLRDQDAAEAHLVGIAVDVTEQQRLALRSAESDLRLRTAIDTIPESFVLWDAEDRLVLSNARFAEFSGLAAGEVQPGARRVDLEPRMTALALERRLAGASRNAATFERQLADGRWLQVTELRTEDGGSVSVGTDITQLKLQQERMEDSERRLMATIEDLSTARKSQQERAQELAELNRQLKRETERAEAASRAKSEFLANISHELRTPLNAIIGFSEVIEQKLFGPIGSPRYEEYVGDIHRSGSHLLGVISDILDMSKIEAGRFTLEVEDIALSELIDEAVKMIAVQADAKSIRVETAIAPAMHVHADRRAMKQILINLLSNAVKFTGTNGRIALRARQTGKAVTISIEDNGCGIPKDALRRIGRPFEQAQNQFSKNHAGSGLGLAISRSLAEMHGGALKLRSTPGAGTIVSLRLPRRAAAD